MGKIINTFNKFKSNTWLPFWMPWVWKIIIPVALIIGISIGALIAIAMLQIRGLV